MATIGRLRTSRAGLRIERPTRTVLAITAAVAMLGAGGAFALGRGASQPPVADRMAVEATPAFPAGEPIVVPPNVRLPR